MSLSIPPPTVTAPDWKTDPVGWSLWYLENNANIYRRFRRELDKRFHHYPKAKASAGTVLDYIRWDTPDKASGDTFSVNNNASALFARLYIAERPQYKANLERRRSFLDDLDAASKWKLANAAKAIRDDPDEQVGMFGKRVA